LYGCLYIDPVVADNPSGVEAEVSWWLTANVPTWLKDRIAESAMTWIGAAIAFAAGTGFHILRRVTGSLVWAMLSRSSSAAPTNDSTTAA
jgi:hypothetical protein